LGIVSKLKIKVKFLRFIKNAAVTTAGKAVVISATVLVLGVALWSFLSLRFQARIRGRKGIDHQKIKYRTNRARKEAKTAYFLWFLRYRLPGQSKIKQKGRKISISRKDDYKALSPKRGEGRLFCRNGG